MKFILIFLSLLFLIGCVSYHDDCLKMENLIFKSDKCESGLAGAGITGHAPSCLSIEDADELKSVCPNFK
jgi:hypothetical protein